MKYLYNFIKNTPPKVFFGVFFLLFIQQDLLATHLRAGEITAKRISSTTLTYRITLTTYTDQVNGIQANEAQNFVKFCFGINGVPIYEVKRKKKQLINISTMCNVYDTTFTFPAQGTYKITCGIPNRNANTVNLPGKTDEISFFIESTIVVNGALGLNNTPVLLNIPIDSAGVGKKFIHNPGAFDADGDSLSYRLTEPKRDLGDGGCGGEFIKGYRDPKTLGVAAQEGGVGPADFRIDPLTGDLIWDAPGKIENFPQYQINVAFVVEEWRKGLDGKYIKIGEITRDMQIIVVETPNNRPLLTVPTQICVEAGSKVEFKVTAADKDNNNIKITTNSGVYNLDQNGAKTNFISPEEAKFLPLNSTQKSPATGTFTWNTNCLHAREQPYDVVFKVEDFPGRFAVQLTDIKTVKIKVLPPRPKGLLATDTPNGVELRWQKYADCNRNTSEIIVYRKEGCSTSVPGNCEVGAGTGYVEIRRVSANDTLYIDRNAEKGKIYSYRLVADLNNTELSFLSVPSNEACIGSELPQRIPLMTNVSIERTDAQNGQIFVRWTRPINLDTTGFKGPYKYQLYRASGIDGTNFQLIYSTSTKLDGKTLDSVYTDKGINTLESVYRYKVEFLYENTKKMGESPAASSVRLTASSDAQRVRLSWQANVPWNNENQKHRVYREVRGKPNTFQLIAEVPVTNANTFLYVDDGIDRYTADGTDNITLKIDTTYCYRVEVVGIYLKQPQYGLLYNFSQVNCASPIDNTPPCPPTLAVQEIDCQNIDRKQICDAGTLSNNLRWTIPSAVNGVNCRKDMLKFNIYFARYQGDQPKLITSVSATETSFMHLKPIQEGFAGCYYITAVNRINVESSASAVICRDNCSTVELPNVITPNGDGKNDTFTPMTCSAFIQTIEIEIYDRNGLKIYESSGNELRWDGKTSSGNDAPSGTYFYLAKVSLQRLNKADEVPTTIKGWVELIR